MTKWRTGLLLTLLLPPPLAVQVEAQEPLPVIDMHLHALAADDQGPPPLGMCTPFDGFASWDPARPFGDGVMARLKEPTCKDPVWSPRTDAELMAQTIEVMKRRNVFGVLSGTPDRVATWMKAAPDRFFPGLGFQLGRDTASPESLRALHAQGRMAVLAEISNQSPSREPRSTGTCAASWRRGSSSASCSDRTRWSGPA